MIYELTEKNKINKLTKLTCLKKHSENKKQNKIS